MLITRKPNRLPLKSLYQGNNWYFVTTCTQDRACLFVEEGLSLQDGNFEMSEYGIIAKQTLTNLKDIFNSITIDEYTIMPNYVHFIIGINGESIKKESGKMASLSNIVGYFKAYTQKLIREMNDGVVQSVNQNGGVNPPLRKGVNVNKIWQKSFYDHIIRDEKDLQRVREYIRNNPLKWELDELNPVNTIPTNF